MPNLIQRLAATQDALGLDDDAMGARCGMRGRMWQYVRTGRYGLSRRALGQVVRSFPGLRDDVLAYLSEDVPSLPTPDARPAREAA